MEPPAKGSIFDLLQKELAVRELSAREVERQLRLLGNPAAVRHKLKDGAKTVLSVPELLAVLEVAKIDWRVFWGMAAGAELPIGDILALLALPDQPPGWRKKQQNLLEAIAEKSLSGSNGFDRYRGELRGIEVLRDDQPDAAELLCWQALQKAFLESCPGGTAGALAALAAGFPRAKAQPLYVLAFQILGPDPRGLPAGKVISSFSRLLIQSGFPEAAITLLKYRALPEVDLEGDGDDRAIVYLNLAWAAGAAGDNRLSIRSLERAVSCAAERLKFGALQQLAHAVLNLGKDIDRAVALYDELITLPLFEKAPRSARAAVFCSRTSALFLAGRLTGPGSLEFAATFESEKDWLDASSRVSVAVDVSHALRQHGHHSQARQILEAELWTVLGLDDGDTHLRQSYLEACSAARMPNSPGLDILRR